MSDPAATPDHTLALAAAPSPQALAVTVTDATSFDSAADPRRIDNVMLWIDGRLVAQAYDTPFPRTQVDARTVRYDVPLDLGVLAVDDGDHALVAGCFRADAGDIGYLSTPFTLAPAPVPAVAAGRIPRAAFHASADLLRPDPGLLAAYTGAGFNAVMGGVFRNPADNASVTTYDEWAAWSLAWLKGNLDWCRANGLLYWGTGDDFLRSPAERAWLDSCPWAEQAARATFALARDYPEFVAVSMLDETPGVPSDLPEAAKLVAWCRAEAGPKLSWPNQRSTRTEPWEDPAVADFADRYYALGTSTWRDGLFKRGTNWQYALEIGRNASQTRTGVPLAFIVAATGPFYVKQVAGGDYQAGDTPKALGVTPEQAVLGVWLPLAYGASALRVYALDTFWADQRLNDPAGSEEQTGLKLGSPVADALGHALAAVGRYEGELLGGVRAARVFGPWVVGRRSGGFEFWLNASDAGQECPVQSARELLTPTGPAAYQGGVVGPGCVVIR